MKIFILFFFITQLCFSIDYFLELRGDYSLQNYEENYWYYKGIAGLRHEGENFYTELSLIGEEGADPSVDLYRGYLEYYIDDLTLSAGRQTISWGHGYIFNFSDVFNEIDIEDPKSDKRGVDSIRFKYSLSDMSRLEFIGFKTDEKDENFAGRYTFLIDDFEVMMNYFHIAQPSPITGKIEKNERIVLETKGDLIIGVWGQISYDKYETDDLYTLVAGIDYNFNLYQKNVYTAMEGFYNKEGGGTYFTYNLRINESFEFYQGCLLIDDGGYLNTTLNYIYNDYVNFEFAYNYYHNFEKYGYLTKDNKELTNEIVFRTKMFF
ncbi:hypothetical protein [Psychrilyobacter atlanticus]|uniref:hypothetical protein n=1 Tax=Psychrilyobacter atlanticus TaxID=271091 RepID=UPI000402B3E8|nr:hypothetical protein [Psychrilyobacter atlanticus]